MASKKVCVIGAGPSGLSAIKQCLDEGFEVVCYEKTDSIGGLWYYRDEDIEGLPSVAKTTIINTSKEMSAFSDFPPSGHFPCFMENKLMLRYFQEYANHYNLLEKINLMHEVIEVDFNDDYEETGKWRVKARNLSTDETTESIFDGVMACSGHHIKPSMPQFHGQASFKGKILHSHSYKKPIGMDDKVAVVVGIGNSGVDVAVELSRTCSQVYLSTRRGSWVANRVNCTGVPFDMLLSRRIIQLIFALLPFKVSSWLVESLLNFYFDHERYGIKPKHRIWSQHPTINDALANCILSGRVKVRPNIERFTEDGVIFDGADTETKCDVVVFATGYNISFPYIKDSIISVQNNNVELYKNVFQPNLTHPHTLAVIGLVQPVGAIFPISEIQSRWFAQLMKGNLRLPSKSELKKIMKMDIESVRKRYYNAGRHTIQVDFIHYMDSIATIIGAKPDLWKYLVTDPVLWFNLVFAPCVPYQYRLQGPHPWPGAREAILNVSQRVLEGIRG